MWDSGYWLVALSFLPGFSVSQAEFYAGRPVLSARGFFGGGEADFVAAEGTDFAAIGSGAALMSGFKITCRP